MVNNSTTHKSLAHNLKSAAVKVSNATATWCGRQSALPTDTKWDKIQYSVFDVVKRDRGNNRALLAAMVKLSCRK